MAAAAGTRGAKPNHVRPSGGLCSSAKALPGATEGRIWKTLPIFADSLDFFKSWVQRNPEAAHERG